MGASNTPCLNRIRELRAERGLTQEELAGRVGEHTTIATISRLESGRMTLTLPWMQRIGGALGVRPHELITPPGESLRMVPLLGSIAAGNWREMIADPQGWVPVGHGAGGPNCFALRPVGDSMNLIADEKSIVVIDPDQVALEDGRIYAVRNADGEATFKKYVALPPRLEPVSSNPAHTAVPIGQEPFVVIGRVTYVAREI